MAIKQLFKFLLHPMSVFALPGETDQAKYALKWMKNVN